MNKKEFMVGALSGALLTFIVGAGIFFVGQKDQVISEETQVKISEIEEAMNRYALYETDEEVMQEYAIRGYVAGLEDPYTVYYTEEEAIELLESISGEYSGIGALLSQDLESGDITITKVYPDTPAEESGLKNGDVIEKVAGEEIDGEDLANVVADIKGEENTTVELEISRGEEAELLEFSVERRMIETPTVAHELLEGEIGYLQVVQFDTITSSQFTEGLEQLQAEGMESLVIDLRNNPGGNLDTVCQMLSELLPNDSTIVTMKDKYGNESIKKSEGNPTLNLPIVVLVNEYSASASEIFAGAVKDYNVGEVVGVTTYGKGLVQQTMGLSDGSMLKVTTAEYFSPNGEKINDIGVEPDHVVEEVFDEQGNDLQLQKAIDILSEN